MDELDEFNEAPHIIRERERRNNSLDATEATVVVLPGGLLGGGGGGERIASAKVEGRHMNELLDSEENQAGDFVTDLNRNSHVVA